VFGPIQFSPYDVKFRLFGIPVRIHPTYWLISLFFVMNLPIQLWPIGIGCMFLALMIHELGHALTFRRYGAHSMIFLYSFGGLAVPDHRLPVRSQRIIVSLAGPFANFVLAGIVWGTDYVLPWQFTNDFSFVTYRLLFIINIFLGLVNLLPVYPLDGGQVSREIWLRYQPGMGIINSLKMSFVVAVLFSAYAFSCYFNVIPPDWTVYWLRPGIFAAVLFAVMAVLNFQELQNEMRKGSYWSDREPWR
jgi:stage IV sporulation protein FB